MCLRPKRKVDALGQNSFTDPPRPHQGASTGWSCWLGRSQLFAVCTPLRSGFSHLRWDITMVWGTRGLAGCPVSLRGLQSTRQVVGAGLGSSAQVQPLPPPRPAPLRVHGRGRHAHAHSHTQGSPAHSTGLSVGLATVRSWVRSQEWAGLEAGGGSRASRASFLGKSPNE